MALQSASHGKDESVSWQSSAWIETCNRAADHDSMIRVLIQKDVPVFLQNAAIKKFNFSYSSYSKDSNVRYRRIVSDRPSYIVVHFLDFPFVFLSDCCWLDVQ